MSGIRNSIAMMMYVYKKNINIEFFIKFWSGKCGNLQIVNGFEYKIWPMYFPDEREGLQKQ